MQKIFANNKVGNYIAKTSLTQRRKRINSAKEMAVVCLGLTWQFYRISLKSPVPKLIWISIIPFYPWICYSYYCLSACHSLVLLRKNWVWDSNSGWYWIVPLLLILVCPCSMEQSMRMTENSCDPCMAPELSQRGLVVSLASKAGCRCSCLWIALSGLR